MYSRTSNRIIVVFEYKNRDAVDILVIGHICYFKLADSVWNYNTKPIKYIRYSIAEYIYNHIHNKNQSKLKYSQSTPIHHKESHNYIIQGPMIYNIILINSKIYKYDKFVN